MMAALEYGSRALIDVERATLAANVDPEKHLVYIRAMMDRLLHVARTANRTIGHIRAAVDGALGGLPGICNGIPANCLTEFNDVLAVNGHAAVATAVEAIAVNAKLGVVVEMARSMASMKRHYLGRCMLGAEPGGTGAVLLGI